MDTSLFGTLDIPQLSFSTDVARIETKFLNEKLWDSYILERVREAGDSFFDRLVDLVAPHIVGLDMVKRAVALQLLSDRLHVLLVGDPGTGKTDILRSISELAPITSYGLGSGTTGVGLVVTMKGDEIKPGLLPMADGGICILDELNLMKEDSRAGLYNAMEKGFITYDKGGKHEQLPARIRLLASANPTGGKLRGGSANAVRRQLPVDAPLLSRFHLVFAINKPNAEEFERIAKSVVERKKTVVTPGDRDIIKRFCSLARGMNPTVSKMVQEEVVLLASRVRDEE
ncbi:MAG: ATP-binding protein, partial [Deltaproteobacteria bacterium]